MKKSPPQTMTTAVAWSRSGDDTGRQGPALPVAFWLWLGTPAERHPTYSGERSYVTALPAGTSVAVALALASPWP